MSVKNRVDEIYFLMVPYPGLDKSHMCICDVIHIINFTNYTLNYFDTSTLTNIFEKYIYEIYMKYT